MSIWDRLSGRKHRRMRCLQCSQWMYPIPRSEKDSVTRFLDKTFQERTGSPHKHIHMRCKNCGFEFMAQPDVDLAG